MLKLMRRAGIVIPRSHEMTTFYQKIRGNLFRRQKEFNSEIYIIQKFFLESEKFLTIPRFFPISDYIRCKIEDKSHEGEDINISHSITPRNDTQKEAMEFMLENDNGIIELNPGMGKTVISIYTIATRKKKSLILVHRDSLIEQWRERFIQFTDIDGTCIEQLTSAKFEENLKAPIILATNQTIVSLLKRKRMEFLIALNEANIGIFIGDEVHTTVGAPTFAECSIHIPSKVVFGLSATPYRWDGNTDIIEYHLGKVYKSDDDSDTMKANVTFMLFDFGIDTPYRQRYLHWEGAFQRSRYLSIMKNSKIFIKMSKSLLETFKDRNTIYVCERIKLIDQLYDWVRKDIFQEVSKFIAGSKMEELETKLTFSTPGKIRDGVDAPWKDVCILTSPIKNIAQMVGRITRSHPGKQTPTVIDMVDIGCEKIATTFYGRLEYYKEKGWNVQYVLIFQDGRKKLINDQEALDILGNL